jgi:hypothetical protein
VYGIACELRAPRAAGLTLAAAFAALPAAVVTALEDGIVDTLLLAGFGVGMLFLLRHLRTGSRAELLLAGLGLGLAFGTKWYGAPYVVIAVAFWALAVWRGGQPWQRVARTTALLAGVILLVGGFWLVRNLVEVGNPVFPAKVDPLGVVVFDAPRDVVRERFGHTLAEYADDPSILREYVWPAMRATFRLPGAAIIAGSLAAAALLVAGRAPPRDDAANRGLALVVLLAAVLGVTYTLLPNSGLGPEGRPVAIGAASRYVAPAALLAAAAAAWSLGRAGRFAALLQLLAAAAVGEGLARSLDVGLGRAALAAMLVVVAGCVAVYAWRRWRSLEGTARPLTATAAVGGALLLVAVGGQVVQERLNDRRYDELNPVFAWIDANAPEGRKIALAGGWGDGVPAVRPAFGPRYGNRVEFVGPFREHMLSRYSTREGFASALGRGDYDLVLLGPLGRAALGSTREERWVRSLGYRPVVRSPQLTLYRPR